MRIVLVTAVYPPLFGGGAGKAVSSLAEALARQGDHVAVVTLHPGRKLHVEERRGVLVYSLPLDNVDWPYGRTQKRNLLRRALWHGIDQWNPMAARRVGLILDREKPDVMHTHILAGFSVSIWREAKKRGIRLVHTVHDYYMLCERSALYRDGHVCEKRCAGCTAFSKLRRRNSVMVDAVLFVSEYVQRRHVEHGYFRRAVRSVVHNVCPGPDCTYQVHQRTDAEIVFGFIGRIEPEKGIEQLLRATLRLNSSRWRLRVAGNADTAYACQLRKTFRDPRIEWLGLQSPANFYGSVDVVVIPSQFPDPFPYVAIETLQHKRPVIAATSGGIPEVLRLGTGVELYDARDESALAERMERAMSVADYGGLGGFQDPKHASLFSEENIVRAHRRTYDGKPRSDAMETQASELKVTLDGIDNPVH